MILARRRYCPVKLIKYFISICRLERLDDLHEVDMLTVGVRH